MLRLNLVTSHRKVRISHSIKGLDDSKLTIMSSFTLMYGLLSSVDHKKGNKVRVSINR